MSRLLYVAHLRPMKCWQSVVGEQAALSGTSKLTFLELNRVGVVGFTASEFPLHIQRSPGLLKCGLDSCQRSDPVSPGVCLFMSTLPSPAYHYIQLHATTLHSNSHHCFLLGGSHCVFCRLLPEKEGKAAPSVFSSARSGGETAFSKPSKQRPIRK